MTLIDFTWIRSEWHTLLGPLESAKLTEASSF
jgi:hypothetical protein